MRANTWQQLSNTMCHSHGHICLFSSMRFRTLYFYINLLCRAVVGARSPDRWEYLGPLKVWWDRRYSVMLSAGLFAHKKFLWEVNHLHELMCCTADVTGWNFPFVVEGRVGSINTLYATASALPIDHSCDRHSFLCPFIPFFICSCVHLFLCPFVPVSIHRHT